MESWQSWLIAAALKAVEECKKFFQGFESLTLLQNKKCACGQIGKGA